MGGIYIIKESTIGGWTPGKIEASLNEKLKNVEWGEYRLGDLFEINTTKSTDKNKIIFNPKGLYDFIGRSNINNGVQGKIDKQKYASNPPDTFSLVQVGESVCLFRDNEWYASQNIFILMPKINELVKQHLFISSVINKALFTYKSAYIYPTLSDVKK